MASINVPQNAIQGQNRPPPNQIMALNRALNRNKATISDIKRRLQVAFESKNPNITPQQKRLLQLELNSFAVGILNNVNAVMPIPPILIQVEALIHNNRPALLGNGGRRSRRRRTRRTRRSRRSRHRK